MESIETLFEELNYPGPARLKKSLKNESIPFTNAQVENNQGRDRSPTPAGTASTERESSLAIPTLRMASRSHRLDDSPFIWQKDDGNLGI